MNPILKATIEDYPSINRMVKKAFRGFYSQLEEKEWVIDAIKKNFFYVIKKNGILIGMMCLENYSKDVVCIEALAISKAQQRKGLGKLFISKAISIVRKMNSHRTKTPKVSKILVYTDDRYKAKGFYVKAGFKQFEKYISDENYLCMSFEMSI